MASADARLIRCPVTYEPWTKEGDAVPMLLSCEHTISKGALSALSQLQEPCCPICRRKLELQKCTEDAWSLHIIGMPDAHRKLLEDLKLSSSCIEVNEADLLGEGSQGRVLGGKLVRAGLEAEEVAVKVLAHPGRQPSGHWKQQQQAAFNELTRLAVVAECAPDEVVQIKGFCHDGVYVKIALERLDQSLQKYLDEHEGGMSLEQVTKIGYKLARGMSVCHDGPPKNTPRQFGGEFKPVLHLDICPGNVLLTEDLDAKISDFGIAQTVSNTLGSKNLVGHFRYTAPEQTDQDGGVPVTAKADVWGLAATLLHAATGRAPYDGDNLRQVIVKHVRGIAPSIPDDLDSDLAELLRRCLDIDPNVRPSMKYLAGALMPKVDYWQSQCENQKETIARLRQEVAMLEQRVRELAAQLQPEELQRRAGQQQAGEARRSHRPSSSESSNWEQHAAPTPSLPIEIAGSLEDLCAYVAGCLSRGESHLSLGGRAFRAATPTTPPDSDAASSASRGRQELRLGAPGVTLEALTLVVPAGGELCLRGDGFRLRYARVRGEGEAAALVVGDGVACARVDVHNCEVRVTGGGVTLDGVEVTGSGAPERVGFFVCAEASAFPGALALAPSGTRVELVGCKVTSCGIGIVVQSRRDVEIRHTVVERSVEHGVCLRRGGQKGGALVALNHVEVRESGRSGVFVETLCAVKCVGCAFARNGHYGIQTFPQATAEVTECQFVDNRRGPQSGKGLVVLPSPSSSASA